MSVDHLDFELDDEPFGGRPLGLIVLSTDETIELEFRRYFHASQNPIYVSRIPSAAEVTHDNLASMQNDLKNAAALLPKGFRYPAVGYGCTSASSVIGSEKVQKIVRQSCEVDVVTNPLRATVAHANSLGLSRFALLSPYIEEVNTPLRQAFVSEGLTMNVFGSFGESNESTVVRISENSIFEAAVRLGGDSSVDAVFLSCTNLRTFDVIPKIEKVLKKPVLSSNRSLAWHLARLAG